MRDVLVYSLLRLAILAGVWWLLYTLTSFGFYLSGILAALIALLLSILVLRRPRNQAAERWQRADERRRARKGEKHDEDADEEDALMDAEVESTPAPDDEDTAGKADEQTASATRRRGDASR